MVLMRWMYHQIRAIERVACRIVISERPARGQYIPRVIEIKVGDAEQKGAVGANDRAYIVVYHDELALRENPVMRGKFVAGVRSLGWVDSLTDC